MNYSTIKAIKTFCESLHSEPNYREVIEAINNNENDFEVDGVRFIDSNSIDEIQQDEISSDLYMLGCFNAWFLADILEIDQEVIEEMQKAEAYTAIGKLIISMNKLEELQEAYQSADGYGHHFNHYDGNEEELTVNGITYHVFDNH